MAKQSRNMFRRTGRLLGQFGDYGRGVLGDASRFGSYVYGRGSHHARRIGTQASNLSRRAARTRKHWIGFR